MDYSKLDILFTNAPAMQGKFWQEEAQAKADELGFSVRMNPHEGQMTPEMWRETIGQADALITGWGTPQLNEEIVGENDNLKIVGHAAGSVARIVCPYLYERGVRVVTANDIMAQAVAEWSAMMTLIGLRNMLAYAGWGAARQVNWQNRMEVTDPTKAVLGIWGYGDISRHLVRYLKPYNFKEMLVVSGHMSDEAAAEAGLTKVDFDELFERADVVHCLTGLTEKNKGRVGAKQLAALKDGATLINAGRSPLIQRQALLDELAKGRITAILDVFDKEPLPEDDELRTFDNVILTPHSAGVGTYHLYPVLVLEEFDRFFKGQALEWEVTPDRAATMTDESLRNKKK